MGDVVRWVDTHEEAEVLDLLGAAGVPEALHAAWSAFGKEDRQRSSIYTTVETILEPFAVGPPRTPEGDRAAAGRPGPPGGWDQHPLPVRAGPRPAPADPALRVGAASGRRARLRPGGPTHRPLDPPLLVVLDEAANIAPLADLDALAATAAGHGVQLVTVWHDLAQITARYGPRATTVVNNHRAKLFLSGISDPSTLDYASHLIGEEEVLLPATTRGGRAVRAPPGRPPPAGWLRPTPCAGSPPAKAVLVYGDLPPARLRLRTWFADPVLVARARAPS